MLYGSVSHIAECPDIGPSCRSNNAPAPYNHHVDMLLTDIQVDLAYGLSSWLAIETRLRLGVVALEATFTEIDGSERTGPETGSIHHRTEVLAGPRDPWLMMRIGGKVGRFLSQARIGLTLPA
ncbi:MAG: hypothetical protein VB934_21580, partial [Polyangiaceae bacterium]